tara:strand:+ start:521 stop:751 length:231 start_codon:yes stop_codon:yes gene_type:complete
LLSGISNSIGGLMRCLECKQPVRDYWEFCEGTVCEDCVLDEPIILHKYNLYMYDENDKKIEGVVSANMVIDVRRKK